MKGEDELHTDCLPGFRGCAVERDSGRDVAQGCDRLQFKLDCLCRGLNTCTMS